jgi:hypothetical protein
VERPILFSTAMVQAILEGRKTQTRRIVKPQTKSIFPDKKDRMPKAFWTGMEWVKPPYQPGDILWVRETWGHIAFENHKAGGYDEWFIYKASRNCELPDDFKWRPSIFMPREAARIFLRVTNVRVERLQDITKEDAIAEGLNIGTVDNEKYAKNNAYRLLANNLPVAMFADLWDSLNAKRGYGWEKNPWVWVIEFEKQ